MRTAWAAIGLVVLLSSLSCDESPTEPSGLDDPAAALAQAQQRWASSRLTNYDFTIAVGCFCAFPREMRFAVRGGTSTTADVEPRIRQAVADFESVDALFDLLRDRLARNPARFEVEYHPSLGYPTQAYLDLSFSVADDELSFSVSSLTPVR